MNTVEPIRSKDQITAIKKILASQNLRDAARAVGVTDPVGTHTLRKTFGYHAYQTGVDLSVIQQLLNHSSPGTTLAYIGIRREDWDAVYLGLNL